METTRISFRFWTPIVILSKSSRNSFQPHTDSFGGLSWISSSSENDVINFPLAIPCCCCSLVSSIQAFKISASRLLLFLNDDKASTATASVIAASVIMRGETRKRPKRNQQYLHRGGRLQLIQ